MTSRIHIVSKMQSVRFLWLIWALFTLLVVFLASVHEPWCDEYHVWNMAYKMSFGEMWNAMRYEGHFCLWQYIVAFWVKLFGMDYHALFLASVPLMSFAAWLFLFRIDFPLLGKMLILFSEPFFYEFAVISRCYALIPPVLIGIIYSYQQKKTFLFCLLLGLLANTHAYMEGTVAILWLIFVYYEVYKKWQSDTATSHRNLKYAMMTVALVSVALWQVVGGVSDAVNNIGHAGTKTNSPIDWISAFYNTHRVRIFSDLRVHLSNAIPDLDLLCSLSLTCVIIVYVTLIIAGMHKKKQVASLLIIFCSLAWQIFFATNIYSIGNQRVYLILGTVLFTVALTYDGRHMKIVNCMAIAMWMLNTPCQYAWFRDFFGQYDLSVGYAKELQETIPEDRLIYSLCGSYTCTELLKRDIRDITELKDIDINHVEFPVYLVSLSGELDRIPDTGIVIDYMDSHGCDVIKNIYNDDNLKIELYHRMGHQYYIYKVEL